MIIDAAVEERLEVAVLAGYRYTTIYTRPVNGKFIVNLSPSIIFFTLYHLLTQPNKNISFCYLLAIFSVVKPKIVIENTHITQLVRLAKACSEIQFFVILNGYWLNIRDGLYGAEDLYHKNLARTIESFNSRIENYHIYVFGTKDVEIFEDEGLSTTNSGVQYHPIGSMLGDCARSHCDLKNIDVDIVWVSQCSSNTLRGSSELQRLLKEQTQVAYTFVCRYVRKNRLSLLIQLRSDLEDEMLERDFYRELHAGLPISVEFSRNSELFSAYNAVARAALVLSIHSTLGYEAMSWGKRVMFLHLDFSKVLKISSSRHVNDTDIWPWILLDANYDAFEMKVEELRNLDDGRYRERIEPFVDYLIGGESQKLAHLSIRDDINKILQQ
ncbi:MAG: hypothetical protein E6Q34_11835 [Burkholderiaceae bacterium]|nr:MAG: hypothetical protein E6Q34_11835 [Burkholderiaceae bacterium]